MCEEREKERERRRRTKSFVKLNVSLSHYLAVNVAAPGFSM